MNPSLWLVCQILVFLIVFGLIGTIIYALKFAFKKLRLKADIRQKLLLFIGNGLLLWLTILGVLSNSDFFQNFQSLPPRILIAVLPPVILIISLLFSRFFKIILKVIPTSWLIYIQSFRILVEVMLLLGFVGSFVPAQMTFLWLNHDIIVGITALLAGGLFFGRRRYLRFEAIIWNVFGILLLVNIAFIAFISTPSPFRIFMNEPANTFVAQVPFIWIPGFIVPFALAMHVFSLKQLLTK